jgi:glutathione synthase/RimK-type ligase-like ATP-grasp enzyme
LTKSCLLITERFEPTADLLVAELRRRGVPFLRWNLDQFPLGSSLTYHFSSEGFGAEILSDGRKLHLDSVASVWCRGFRPCGVPGDFRAADRKFSEEESQRALDGLFTVADPLWINHPYNHRRANSKPAQLYIARYVGFEIPPTVISNNAEEVRRFVAQAKGKTVYKALSQSLDLDPGKALFTGLLTEKELLKLDLIRVSPGIFQAFVPKSYELRITVVGSRIFAGKINSQASDETKIDWRHKPFDIEPEPVELSSDMERKIHSYMQFFGLLYGAFDFIVTPEGRYVFLEVNPAGQYMWVESKTGLPITAALADALSKPCTT